MDTNSQIIKSMTSRVLDLPPSCVEFSPVSPEYFLVGTYYLEGSGEAETGQYTNVDQETEEEQNDKRAEQRRSGSLILCRLNGCKLEIIQTLPTPSATLDLHFSPHNPTLVVLATSTGSISFYEFTLNGDSTSLSYLKTEQYFKADILVLAVAFHPLDPDIVGMSLSTGELVLSRINNLAFPQVHTGGLATPFRILAHSLEAWTLAFDPLGRYVYTGGDDSVIQRHAREEDGNYTGRKDRKTHGAGVTAILPILRDEILLTGSYDDCVRVYDSTTLKVLAEKNLGGGVWRLKQLREHRRIEDDVYGEYECQILASCMHAGARILEVIRNDKGKWSIDVLAKFEEHGSMNYGSDVQPFRKLEQQQSNDVICVTTSFYDRLLCIWRFEG
ncbi:MAG: hypothetical protein M1827_001628 [Pycnora praestabilis]|nr:MAG: hypothetical protein M1827_001628 [Pycnora praestabilis]